MAPLAVADLVAALELISRARPDRVLRLTGWLQPAHLADAVLQEASEAPGEPLEPFELLIFRGFSSSLSHPTGFDPDQPALPANAHIEAAELLLGPLNPSREQRLAGPAAVEGFLDPAAWL
jgi:hypothetical protein